MSGTDREGLRLAAGAYAEARRESEAATAAADAAAVGRLERAAKAYHEAGGYRGDTDE